MPQTRSDRQQVLERLTAALATGVLPARAAEGCARLVERLDRPVRVAFLGTDRAAREALLRRLAGGSALPPGGGWPTLELVHGASPRCRATLADASVMTAEGPPGGEILALAPVFLQVAAPLPILTRMSFLHLAVGADPGAQAAALAWAARRADIAVWCTETFTAEEARIWAAAPETLKGHALMAVFEAERGAANRLRRPREMIAAVAVPRPGDLPDVSRLLDRLEDEIEAARSEDIDAARLVLHRFGLDSPADPATAPAATARPAPAGPLPAPEPAPEPVADADAVAPPPAAAPVPQPQAAAVVGPDTAAVLSEPILFLKRRARALAEALDWPEEGEDSEARLFEDCTEIAEGLRDRAADWPEDDDALAGLAAFVAEAADTALLLQVEGGADRAADAAALILQLRFAIEARLPLPPAPDTDLKIAC